MAKHRKPEPGEPGWSHPDVKGETDPAKIKAEMDRIEAADRAERERVALERVQGKW